MDDQSTSTVASTKPRRRWYQFSLRTLMIVSVLSSFAAAWYGNNYIRVNELRTMVAKLKAIGCTVKFDYEINENGSYKANPSPPGPALSRWIFGDDVYANISVVIPGLRGLLKQEDWKVLEKITRLRLVFSGAGWTNDSLRSISQLSNLRSIELFRTSVTCSVLESTQNLHNLEELRIDGAALYIKRSPNDESLTKDVIAFKQLIGMINLKKLTFDNTDITDAEFEHLSKLPKLTSLSFRGCKITGAGFDHFKTLSDLTSLNLDNTAVNDEAIRKLAFSTKQLQALSLSKTNLNDFITKRSC